MGSNPIRSIPHPGSTAHDGHDIPSDSAAAGYNNGGGADPTDSSAVLSYSLLPLLPLLPLLTSS